MTCICTCLLIFLYLNFQSCGNLQPEAIGHTRTCLQPESGGRHYISYMHSLQPCQLPVGNDSLLNMVLHPLLDMRGGASLCNPLEIPGGFLGSASDRSLRSGHNHWIWEESQNIPIVIGAPRGFEPAT